MPPALDEILTELIERAEAASARHGVLANACLRSGGSVLAVRPLAAAVEAVRIAHQTARVELQLFRSGESSRTRVVAAYERLLTLAEQPIRDAGEPATTPSKPRA